MAKKKSVSLNPENFTEGGGLIDDVDVTFKELAFVMYDYNGLLLSPVPSLKVVMDVDELDDDVDQYYSMGSPNDWMPSDDGSQLIAVGKAENIRASSNGGIFLKSIIDAGYPPDELGDDITVLEGLRAHVIRVPAPKRAGLKKTKRSNGKEYESTILIVGEILEDKPKSKGKGKGKGKAKPKASSKKESPKDSGGGGDVSDETTEIIMGILAEEESVSKKDLPAKLFQLLKGNPNRNAIVKMAFDDEFLEEGPWTYEDGVITL